MSRWSYFAAAVAVAVASYPVPAFAASDQLQQLEAECAAGDGFACKKLGTRLNMGYPGPPQPVKARAAYERGCELKNSVACAFLYQMLALGEGGAQDLKRAKQLEEAACNHPQIGISGALRATGLCAK